MWQNPHFNDIFLLIRSRKFSKAYALTENYLITHAQQGDREDLSRIGQDYELLTDYWRKGFDDNQRSIVYTQLLRRLYVFVANLSIHDRIEKSSLLSIARRNAQSKLSDFSIPALRQQLEDYVSDVAMLDLEPEHLRKQKAVQLYLNHQQFMSVVFGRLLSSDLLRDSEVQAFEDLLLAPTVDPIDQRHILSALTLSGMNAFCFNKFRLMADIYRLASDEQVRQRALIGWVFCADGDMADLYPEICQIIKELCGDERCRRELTELQMQMVYCTLADDDSQTIKNEIIPDLMKGNNIKMTRHGIVEIEEDSLEEILHPDNSEQNMERMEASMKKMADMQRKGSDIYFAGFSQMKRFPFFSDISNWFVPFYPQHPLISTIWNQTRGNKFLQMITRFGAFCDSDKYSFVLAFDQVLSHIPPSMMQMIERGEASPMAVGGEVPVEEQRQPAFIRRTYLQNLYRFFRLFPQRSEFFNPFDTQHAIFFSDALYREVPFEENMTEIASFLIKRGMKNQALSVLDNQKAEDHTVSYYLLMGQLMLGQGLQDNGITHPSALYYFQEALRLEPTNQRALMGAARASFAEERYQEALDAFEKTLQQNPENLSVELNITVCLIQLGRTEEALKILHRLHYNAPDNDAVTRILAWALALSDSYEQANKLYNRLVSIERPHADDLLNYGYCLWFQKDIPSAVSFFRQYVGQSEDESLLEQDFMVTEHAILLAHGISDVEIQLMLDSVHS